MIEKSVNSMEIMNTNIENSEENRTSAEFLPQNTVDIWVSGLFLFH